MSNEGYQKKKIFIADDERNIRELIRSFLESAGYVVETFESGDALFEAFQNEVPDLVVLDVNMPGTDGFTLCERLRSMSPIPIIIVSARDTELDRITGISLGSDDYMVKPFSPVELVARINGIFRRMQLNSIHSANWKDKTEQSGASVLTYQLLKIDDKQRTVSYGETILEITPTEYDFLKYLVTHQDRAVSREELLKEVWQFDFDVDTRATDDVVKRLRKKLATTGVRIGAVWGFGFKLESERRNEESQSKA